MPRPSIKFTPSHPSKPWRVYFNGKSYWLGSKKEAGEKAAELFGWKGDFSVRELDELRQARAILGPIPLLTAVRTFAASNVTTITMEDAMLRHNNEETIGRRPKYLEAKKYNLDKLAALFSNRMLGTITQEELLRARASMTTPNVMNSFIEHARVFFRWAERLNLLAKVPTRGIKPIYVTNSRIVMTLTDADLMLSVCKEKFPSILQAVTLQLLTGIRTYEVCRLTWDKVQFGKQIIIEERVAKTKQRRVIDYWPPRLSEWLVPGFKGPIVVRLRGKKDHDLTTVLEDMKGHLVDACKKERPEFGWGQNAMRHTFASYAIARWQSAARVALLMGDTERILKKHYWQHCSEEEGYRYFGETMPRASEATA